MRKSNNYYLLKEIVDLFLSEIDLENSKNKDKLKINVDFGSSNSWRSKSEYADIKIINSNDPFDCHLLTFRVSDHERKAFYNGCFYVDHNYDLNLINVENFKKIEAYQVWEQINKNQLIFKSNGKFESLNRQLNYLISDWKNLIDNWDFE